ncbi:hypothetical protein [Methanoregula sp.]|uniref:hypothetical protein n=1 Tax=Methanoregula sp. TaxID=2052170 RepID=UPI002633BFA0|nr:hypothetical protein [Methanoregula sp.]MDD5143581.1 hypothetical protein [Methanoregula sp.]
MFIGHFAVAYLLIALFPTVPPLVILFGVSFPDLLWPVLILTGRETVTVSPDSPLQNAIGFTSYPYSHSLVTGTLIAAIPGLAIAYFVSPLAGVVFVAASASHWLLDVVTHRKDLPVLGTGNDTKVGLGLWNYPRRAFVIELIFYVGVTVLAVPPALVVPLLALGLAFHLINANSFLGFSKKNPFTARGYAVAALLGFLAFIGIAAWIFGGM